MPGGNEAAQGLLEDVFRSISAEVTEADGSAVRCSKWIGRGGSGHFVKMIHNGIEYGDMEIISEAYHLMTAQKQGTGFRLTNDQAAESFRGWNNTELAGFLNEITADILKYKDTDGSSLIDSILDAAGRKAPANGRLRKALTLCVRSQLSARQFTPGESHQ